MSTNQEDSMNRFEMPPRGQYDIRHMTSPSTPAWGVYLDYDNRITTRPILVWAAWQHPYDKLPAITGFVAESDEIVPAFLAGGDSYFIGYTDDRSEGAIQPLIAAFDTNEIAFDKALAAAQTAAQTAAGQP